MAQGFKTGGRQKGTLNKNRGALLAKLEDSFPSYDPSAGFDRNRS